MLKYSDIMVRFSNTFLEIKYGFVSKNIFSDTVAKNVFLYLTGMLRIFTLVVTTGNFEMRTNFIRWVVTKDSLFKACNKEEETIPMPGPRRTFWNTEDCQLKGINRRHLD